MRRGHRWAALELWARTASLFPCCPSEHRLVSEFRVSYLFYYCGLSWPDNEQNQNIQTIYGFNASVCNFKHRNPVSAEPLSLVFTHTLMDVHGFTRALGFLGRKLLHP